MKRTHVLTARYVGALLAIGALLVIGQAVVQLALDRQQGDASVVNVAGRQRMLSQRLCMLLLELAGEDRAAARQELSRVADEWERTEDELQHGGPRIGAGITTPSLRAALAAIDDDQRAMLSAARAALAAPPGQAAPYARAALAHEEAFLDGMNRIVASYEREARHRVEQLRATELVLLGVILCVLALEGAFVFRPAVRALRTYIAQQRAIVEALPDRLVLLATDGTIVDVGGDADPKPVLPANVVASWLSVARDTLASGKLGRVDYRDGPREYEGRMVRLTQDRVLVVIRDVTDLSRLERQLIHVSDREVVRLSHDLHDGVGQHLIGVASLVQTLRRELAGAPQETRVGEIHQLLADAVAQTRDLSRNLSPPVLEHDGLVAALRELASHTERTSGVACTLHCEEAAIDLPPQQQAHLHRIAREAVLNAVKHAHAKAIEIELHGDAHAWNLTVRDDGVGIAEHEGDGMGLHLMAYRAKMLGASLRVARVGERGTVVSCVLEKSS